MNWTWLNPEVLRHLRAALRPGRMLAAAGLCAALSLAIGFSMARASEESWGGEFLTTIL